jgi:hypothetical protein
VVAVVVEDITEVLGLVERGVGEEGGVRGRARGALVEVEE